jgi:hypothetical protein
VRHAAPVLEIALVWALGAVLAGLYWWGLQRARRSSPPMPAMDSLLTALFRASVTIESWGNQAFAGRVQLDGSHLVLTVGRSHRAVVPRSAVHALHPTWPAGWRVEHAGQQPLGFTVHPNERSAFVEHARRLGWPLDDA